MCCCFASLVKPLTAEMISHCVYWWLAVLMVVFHSLRHTFQRATHWLQTSTNCIMSVSDTIWACLPPVTNVVLLHSKNDQ